MIRWTGEAEAGFPFWWEDRLEAPALAETPPEQCDILVIGAGYTGLSAAIAAKDAGSDVVVVDAGDPGQGASTRNGGMFGAHPRLGWEKLAEQFGVDVADGIFAEAKPALDFVKDLIAREGIDCDLSQTGRIQLAWTQQHFDAQKRLVDRVREKSDVAIEVVERAGLGREIATERYVGGIVFPEHCALHPRKFHNGLLHAVTSRGVPVAANCPVSALDRTKDGFQARTPKGAIQARKVILATNGYTPRAFRWHQKRVFPLPSYLIATEPLPENLLGHLAPGRRMMVETRARHSYFRISPNGKRILFGGRASMRDVALTTAAGRLRETLLEVWPDLADAQLSHVWTGYTGYSFNHMPHVGSDRGLHYALGYSGSGTVMAPYLGAKAAWRALGDPRGDTAYARTTLRPSPLHPFSKPYFLALADLWYRTVVDTRESRRGR